MQSKSVADPRLRGLYQALIATGKKLGFRLIVVSGTGGECRGFVENDKFFRLGREQSLEDKVIVLSYLVGVALDMIKSPPTIDEVWDMVDKDIPYSSTPKFLQRRKNSWQYAKEVLVKMAGFKHVQERLIQLRRRSILEAGQTTENPIE